MTVVTSSTNAFAKDISTSDIFTDVISKYYDNYNRTNLIFLFEDT